MSATDLTRRSFLNASVTLGGGLILGLTLPGKSGNSSAAAASRGAAQLNAWLKIAPDNSITFIVDRSEMGQGVFTALPMLLAEELHVSLDAIGLDAAPVGDAYVSPGNGGQVTGTSNSVQESWDKLRIAGAQARIMLTQAAAKRWRIDPNECRAENGCIINAHGGKLTYGALAEAAAKEPVPEAPKLKNKSEFSIIGKPRLRLDTPGKIDGSAQFGLDIRLPGMLYAALAQSPVLGGTLKSVDSAAAKLMPGVRKVLALPNGVIVVAEHFWQALRARAALKIDWDAGANAQLDNAAIAALLKKAAAAGDGLTARADGDANKALKAAAQSLQVTYELPLLAHATMEPMNCTADVKNGGCDLYVGTQVQQVAQMTAAEAAGLKPEQVRVFTTLLGGGFGRRLDVDFIPAAVHASKEMRAPVKVVWTREDDIRFDYYHTTAAIYQKAAVDGRGRPTAG